MRLLIIFACCLFVGFAFGQDSIEDLKKQLEQAGSSKEKMYLHYDLAEAYLRSNTEASIEQAKLAHRLATEINNSSMGAEAAFLVGRGYERDRDERNAEVWYRTALAKAKDAGDSDLIIKSVERRSRLAEKDRNYRKAYQIVEEAFNYFSQNGTSISDLERKYEQQRKALDQERQRLQAEIDRLSEEKDLLSSDRDQLQQQQQRLVQEKQQVEQEVNKKEERLADVSAAKAKADSLAQLQEVKVKQLSRQKLEQDNVLKTQEIELNKAIMEAERSQREAERNKEQRNQLMILAGSGILLTLLLLVLFLISRRNRRQLKDKNRMIEQEKERSNELLLNILPANIAEELREYGKAQTRKYDEVTVLFSDFINFSRISEQLSPEELVEELDRCFKGFDFIIGNYPEIEKIKTIGDAYMCASGLDNRKTMPGSMIKAALEMQEYLEEQKQERMRLGKPYFEARIGIHTGPAVAGVVGVNKFAYDIWGDTVNTASRMETNGQAGRVNISEATYNLIKYQFDCEYRGKVQAKNKGLIDMYFVKGARAGATVSV
ncbi:MAG: adenylate/guanylate cyclase domain-containing protein [Phaeodactylibacter xiamenensis]|uniref:adenylate/guanylate cyclase domain-containing protein n=1 Tax=Phaeodactylibacter xiamenensis TaxID=1524460 RepID=UPI000697C4CD|nr:adenylate/guanylate cyclase domain-containing protein [Phaeodactylibacter xiamenensis]MCR9054275.1 adenylate/guanylate cyclase domain-containing protein [bacterium]